MKRKIQEFLAFIFMVLFIVSFLYICTVDGITSTLVILLASSFGSGLVMLVLEYID